MSAETALLAAAAVHAGFQLTVTALVYPALFRAPDWEVAHAAHSRAITPLVVLVYGAVVAAATWVLVDGVSGPASWVALAGIAVFLAVTAFRAAPLHGRLAAGRDPALVRSLRGADGVRSLAGLVALVGASIAAL